MCVHMIIVYPFAYIHFFTLQFLIVHNLNSHGRFQAKSHFQLVLLCSFQNHVSPATQMIPVSLRSFKCIPGFQPKNEESVMSLGLCLCEEHIPSCLGKDATSSAFQECPHRMRREIKSNAKKGNFTIPKEREKKKLFKSKTDISLPFLWYTVFSSQKKLDSNNNFTLLVKGQTISP